MQDSRRRLQLAFKYSTYIYTENGCLLVAFYDWLRTESTRINCQYFFLFLFCERQKAKKPIIKAKRPRTTHHTPQKPRTIPTQGRPPNLQSLKLVNQEPIYFAVSNSTRCSSSAFCKVHSYLPKFCRNFLKMVSVASLQNFNLFKHPIPCCPSVHDEFIPDVMLDFGFLPLFVIEHLVIALDSNSPKCKVPKDVPNLRFILPYFSGSLSAKIACFQLKQL